MGFLIGLVLVVVSAVLVGADASSLKRKGILVASAAASSPAGWVAGCIIFWIVFFPWYLIARSSAVSASPQAMAAGSSQWSRPVAPLPQAGAQAFAPKPASIAD